MSIGKRGAYLNSGIPGTGLYSRERLSPPVSRPSFRVSSRDAVLPTVAMKLIVEAKDDGTIYFTDSDGNPVSEYIAETAKKQQGAIVRELMATRVAEINAAIESLGRLHFDTPDCRAKPKFVMKRLAMPKPSVARIAQLGFFARLLPWKRRQVESQNQRERDLATRELQIWEASRAALAFSELARKRRIEKGIYADNAEMERFLTDTLQEIVWPRETDISFAIEEGGKKVILDVDLPEIEDLPTRKAALPAKEFRLLVRELSPAQLQNLYMDHVHGIGFRIIGETFATLPLSQLVVLSAYTQRPDPATGQVRDDYLYSVRVARMDWAKINFAGLSGVNVVDALGAFEMRRAMTKKGTFSPIEPFLP